MCCFVFKNFFLATRYSFFYKISSSFDKDSSDDSDEGDHYHSDEFRGTNDKSSEDSGSSSTDSSPEESNGNEEAVNLNNFRKDAKRPKD